jgi:hypothetical protein
LRELQRLGTLQVQREDHTLRFGHAEAGERRELTLERPSPRLAPVSRTPDAAAVLFAPVADEFRAEVAGQPLGGAYRGAILQGWLRSLAPGHRVEPLPLSALDDALADVLTGFGVLFASTEDLRAVAASPAAQLDALRACFGSTPRLAVTGGSTGSWLDDEDGRVRVLPRVKITSHRTVGAGDAFAALTIAELARGTTLRVAAERATDAVVDLLEVRST